jgi:hypothetical protein
MTNRNLYEFVRNLKDKHKGESLPSLEDYLCSLWSIVSRSQHSLPTFEKLVEWLEKAFTEEPPQFNPDWMERSLWYEGELTDYADWEHLILFQIADLRRMAEAGILENEYRYYGIDSPSGSRWYNFDPLTYLECGVRGMYGGYEEDEVIVLIPPPEGESADSPVCILNEFTWQDFSGILKYGQEYE